MQQACTNTFPIAIFFLMLWMELPKPHEIGGFKVDLFELDSIVFLVLPPEKST
jgi:hypothetical protein